VSETVGTVTETGTTATDALTDTVSETTNAVGETLNETTEAVSETVGTVTETGTTATDALTDTVSETTNAVGETLNETTEAVGETAGLVDETVGAAGNTVGGAQPPVVVDPPAPIADVPQPLAEANVPAADISRQFVDPITDAVVPVPVPDIVMPTDGEQAVEVVVSPFDVDMQGTLFGPPEAGTTSSVERVYDALFGVELEVIQAVGATGLIAAGALTIARGASSVGSSVMFTNVRLLPCFIGSTIQQSGATAISSGTRLGARVTDLAPSRLLPPTGSIVGSFRDGLDRALGDGPLVDGYEDGRERLMAQIGVVLGTIYLAFLTVWFWATRVRWNGGWREKV
jgi:hypothetical protein